MEAIKDFFLGPTVKRTDYMFDTPHLITLAIVIIASIGLPLIFRNKSKKSKDTVLWVFFGILLFFEITSRVVNLILKKDIITTILPWHFCSIMVWMMIFTIPFKNQHMLNITAMGGLIATTAFLVHPAVGFNVEVMKFSQYYSVISHSLGFVLSVFLLSSGYVKYTWKNFWPVALFMGLVYIHSFLANFWWYPGSNYLYYLENPFAGALENWFLPLYIIVVTIYVLSFFAIPSFYGKIRARRLSTQDKNK